MFNQFNEDKKYILDKFYKSYNREIDTLWQRSLFLTAFITGVFIAYGKVFEIVVKLKHISYSEFFSYSLILFFIAVVGIIFSLLWIFMSKASKGNQEIYEAKISIMSKKIEIDASKCSENIDAQSFFEETGVDPKIIGVVNRKKMGKYSKWDQSIKNNFFSLKAGKYSVSKINIFIGYVFLAVWSFLAYIHLFGCFVLKEYGESKHYFNKYIKTIYSLISDKCILFVILLFVFFVLIWILYHIIGKALYSWYLDGIAEWV